ncbi:hypothetical protein TrCOL_g4916 [Triparma columacea]|uniref:Uncharacterized protein n=1 Tax=Triparma columacea TaxID=722753 RepID=A0A9W7LB25_9STRA|nr:hypothetical protein TrCOL_g4916 [Triparma columacea]
MSSLASYDPSVYSSSNDGDGVRDWNFADFEERAVAYLVVKGGQKRLGAKGSSKARSDKILQEILRSEGVYNPQSCANRPRRDREAWEVCADFNRMVMLAGRDAVRSGVEGPDGPWHKSNKQFGDGQGEENRKPFNKYEPEINGDHLLAETKGFKHRRTFEQWKAKKDSEMKEKGGGQREKRRREREEKLKREEDCKRVFNAWLEKKEKMAAIERRKRKEEEEKEEKEKEGGKEEEERADIMKRRPWREKVDHDSRALKARREEEELRRRTEEEKNEIREGRKKMAEGVFLEWLTEKGRVEREKKKESKERKAKETERKALDRKLKWKKGVVGGCHYHGEAMNKLREKERGGKKKGGWR